MWTMILHDVVSDVIWILFLLWALRSNSSFAERLRFIVRTRIMKTRGNDDEYSDECDDCDTCDGCHGCDDDDDYDDEEED
jgi:hypothetical protein